MVNPEDSREALFFEQKMICGNLQCERKRQGEEEKKERERLAEQEMDKPVSYIDRIGNDVSYMDKIGKTVSYTDRIGNAVSYVPVDRIHRLCGL